MGPIPKPSTDDASSCRVNCWRASRMMPRPKVVEYSAFFNDDDDRGDGDDSGDYDDDHWG